MQRVAEAARSGNAPPAIAFSGISVAYPLKGGGRYVALGETDLVVADGEFTAIVGPTGCGKSTLLNVAAGLVPAASGGCAVFGKQLQGLNRDAGYLFQADPLPLRWLRNAGLRWVNQQPEAKALFVRQALGLSGDLPDLARARLLMELARQDGPKRKPQANDSHEEHNAIE